MGHGCWGGPERLSLATNPKPTHSPSRGCLVRLALRGDPLGGRGAMRGKHSRARRGRRGPRPEVAQTPAAGWEPTARMWPRACSAQVTPADPLHRPFGVVGFFVGRARAPLPSYEPKTHSQPLPRVLVRQKKFLRHKKKREKVKKIWTRWASIPCLPLARRVRYHLRYRPLLC